MSKITHRVKKDPLEIISHEIKNTLAVIKVFTQILEKRLRNTEDKKSLSYLTKIDNQIDKLTEFLKKGKKHEREKD